MTNTEEMKNAKDKQVAKTTKDEKDKQVAKAAEDAKDSGANVLKVASTCLDTYSGRDKMLKILGYATKMLIVKAPNNDVKQKLEIFSKQMTDGRLILRMLDDIPMIHRAITYGLGEQEPDEMIRYVQLMQNMVNIFFCITEHIYFAGYFKIASVNTKRWNILTVSLWIMTINLSIIKTCKILYNNYKMKAELNEHEKNNEPSNNEGLIINGFNYRNDYFTLLRLILDVGYAVNYLPPNVLWGNRLQVWHVGTLGTLSSLIACCQIFNEQKKK